MVTDRRFTAYLFVIDLSAGMLRQSLPVTDGLRLLLDVANVSSGLLTVDTVYFGADTIEIAHRFASPDAVELRPTIGGASHLWDAVALGVLDLERRIDDLPEHARPSTVRVVVASAGADDSSSYFTSSLLGALLRRQEKRAGWVFSFLGAKRNEVLEGRGMPRSAVSRTMP